MRGQSPLAKIGLEALTLAILALMIWLTVLAWKRRQQAAAELALRIALQQPMSAPAMKLGVNSRLDAILNKLLPDVEQTLVQGKQTADDWRRKGEALADLGRNEEALSAFREALLIAPHNAQALVGKGTVLLRLRRSEEALAAFEQALALDPQNGNAWEGKAVALVELNRFDAARTAFEQALVIRREVGDREGEVATLNSLGSLAYHRGQPDEAMRYVEQGLAIVREVGDRTGEGAALNNLGQLAENLVVHPPSIW